MSRYDLTVKTALAIRRTGYRFDKTWRHASEGYQARFYARCCTFAANIMADAEDFAIEALAWRGRL